MMAPRIFTQSLQTMAEPRWVVSMGLSNGGDISHLSVMGLLGIGIWPWVVRGVSRIVFRGRHYCHGCPHYCKKLNIRKCFNFKNKIRSTLTIGRERNRGKVMKGH